MRAFFTGATVLPLVAGIGCFAFLCSQFWVLKSRRPMKGIDIDTKKGDRISQLPDDDVDIDPEDRISQLSDDVITLIISRLYTRDVVRTSVLSKRWRDVYTFITEVRFHCPLMPGTHEGGKLRQSQIKFVQGVDNFLRRHSGSKLKSFKFTCCSAGIFRNLMKSISRLGVEQLIIEICYCSLNNPPVFSSDFLLEASPIKCLPNQNFLKVLELHRVSFTFEEVECILSNCSSLQSLKLIICRLPSKLQIHGPDLQLKSLVISSCSHVREIDLSAVNLISFEIYHIDVIKLSFSYVPLLQNLFIEFHETEKTCLLGEGSENLHNLECMFFKTYAICFERYIRARVMNKLCNLRHLVLMLKSRSSRDILAPAPSLDLLSLTVILDACPLLQKFHLSMMVLYRYKGNGKQAEKRVVTCQTQLKEVEFSGFSGTRNEYNFISYILRNVVSLKRLSIFLNARHYESHLGDWAAVGVQKLDEEMHQMIRKQLQGQAISKNVSIVITA